jgi:hypothetical protein
VFVAYPLWWARALPFIWLVVAFPTLLSLLRRSRITAARLPVDRVLV